VAAAAQWAAVLAGEVDVDALGVVLDDLAAHQLPWEASRLAGQAAIRSTDAGLARRLLERARELSNAEVPTDSPRSTAATSGLSEREIEVAQLVMAGRTHREIGSQLYLSPKTVEHHVARMRTKLGATSRAEFLAALRDVLGDDVNPR
jgi:DNA-binding CsgD family transcriptional regulator